MNYSQNDCTVAQLTDGYRRFSNCNIIIIPKLLYSDFETVEFLAVRTSFGYLT